MFIKNEELYNKLVEDYLNTYKNNIDGVKDLYLLLAKENDLVLEKQDIKILNEFLLSDKSHNVRIKTFKDNLFALIYVLENYEIKKMEPPEYYHFLSFKDKHQNPSELSEYEIKFLKTVVKESKNNIELTCFPYKFENLDEHTRYYEYSYLTKKMFDINKMVKGKVDFNNLKKISEQVTLFDADFLNLFENKKINKLISLRAEKFTFIEENIYKNIKNINTSLQFKYLMATKSDLETFMEIKDDIFKIYAQTRYFEKLLFLMKNDLNSLNKEKKVELITYVLDNKDLDLSNHINIFKNISLDILEEVEGLLPQKYSGKYKVNSTVLTANEVINALKLSKKIENEENSKEIFSTASYIKKFVISVDNASIIFDLDGHNLEDVFKNTNGNALKIKRIYNEDSQYFYEISLELPTDEKVTFKEITKMIEYIYKNKEDNMHIQNISKIYRSVSLTNKLKEEEYKTRSKFKI